MSVLRMTSPFIFFLIINAGLGSQAENINDLARLLPKETAGWKSFGDYYLKPDQAMKKYLGPRSTLILGFDCRALLVRQYTDGREFITLEAFLTAGAAEAFGIYSHFQAGASPLPGIGQDASYCDGKLHFWKGPFFFTLSGDSAAEKKSLILNLGVAVSAAVKTEGPKPRLLLALPAPNLIERSTLYFHRQASLDTRYVLADENALGLNASTETILAEYDNAGSKVTLIILHYPAERPARLAFERFSRDYFLDKYKPGMSQIVEWTEYDEVAGVSISGRFLVMVLGAPSHGFCQTLLKDSIASTGRVFPGRPVPEASKSL